MKTQIYYLVAATLLFSCTKVNAEEGIEKRCPVVKQQSIMKPHRDSVDRTETQKPSPEKAENPITRAMGLVEGSYFLQDIRVYEISYEMRLAVGYVSGTAATEIGYMGFKVGDKVTWAPQMADPQSVKTSKKERHLTGVVDLLDSNKCYIKVDHCKLVAVKLYEDISRVNP
jgi:hypothetical protein